MHLVTYDDSVSLEKLIQYSGHIAQRLAARPRTEPTVVPSQPPIIPFSNTPHQIPMQLNASRQSREERARPRSKKLCLYCGGPGDMIVDCAIRPPRTAERTIYSPTISTKLSLLDVVVISPLRSVSAQGPIDSGAPGSFISHALLNLLHLPRGDVLTCHCLVLPHSRNYLSPPVAYSLAQCETLQLLLKVIAPSCLVQSSLVTTVSLHHLPRSSYRHFPTPRCCTPPSAASSAGSFTICLHLHPSPHQCVTSLASQWDSTLPYTQTVGFLAPSGVFCLAA
ncbi:hypothetical protein E1301_Tti013426 [Triplophysa tibetana]|uniref:Retrotransposon-derived protein PEG10 n=1 Tax=Triplophysa tibetana TaxID=1572043 RepID=A0A5A9NWK1_9TELE|nr:hypothetical protein E1301_Tti013426 [Triplophysa tibetana]